MHICIVHTQVAWWWADAAPATLLSHLSTLAASYDVPAFSRHATASPASGITRDGALTPAGIGSAGSDASDGGLGDDVESTSSALDGAGGGLAAAAATEAGWPDDALSRFAELFRDPQALAEAAAAAVDAGHGFGALLGARHL